MGNKKSIKWHEETISDLELSMLRQRDIVEREKAELQRFYDRFTFYRDQIAAAKKKDMDGFDRDRFMVKRGKK